MSMVFCKVMGAMPMAVGHSIFVLILAYASWKIIVAGKNR